MKKWFKNISFSILGKSIAMVLWLLFDILAARTLMVNEYAEWVFYYSILTICFYIGWFGINVSSKVYVSHSMPEEKNGVIHTTLVVRFAVSTILLLVMLIVMPAIASVFGYPYKYENLKTLLEILPFIVFFNSIVEYNKEIFIGLESFKKVFAVTTSEYAGFAMMGFVLLYINTDVKSLAVAYLLGELISASIGIWFINHDSPILRKAGFDSSLAKKVLRYAVPIAFISFGGLVLVEMDTFMLGILSTPENISNYSIAKNLCSKATHVNYALTVGVMTTFAIIEDNYESKRNAFIKASVLNLAVAFVVAIFLFVLGDYIIYILYGSKYPMAGSIIKILTIYYILYAVSNFFSSFLDFRDKAGIRSLFYISVMVLNLLLNYFWIPQYGAMGAAVATSISLVPYMFMVTIQTCIEWKSVKQYKRVTKQEG